MKTEKRASLESSSSDLRPEQPAPEMPQRCRNCKSRRARGTSSQDTGVGVKMSALRRNNVTDRLCLHIGGVRHLQMFCSKNFFPMTPPRRRSQRKRGFFWVGIAKITAGMAPKDNS